MRWPMYHDRAHAPYRAVRYGGDYDPRPAGYAGWQRPPGYQARYDRPMGPAPRPAARRAPPGHLPYDWYLRGRRRG